MTSANRILVEQPIGEDWVVTAAKRRPARSVTVNQAESPLGPLLSRTHLTKRQFDAGVTVAWDSAPLARSPGGKPLGPEASLVQIDAPRRFDDAIAAAGPGLSDTLWPIVCSGEGMREAGELSAGRRGRASWY